MRSKRIAGVLTGVYGFAFASCLLANALRESARSVLGMTWPLCTSDRFAVSLERFLLGAQEQEQGSNLPGRDEERDAVIAMGIAFVRAVALKRSCRRGTHLLAKVKCQLADLWGTRITINTRTCDTGFQWASRIHRPILLRSGLTSPIRWPLSPCILARIAESEISKETFDDFARSCRLVVEAAKAGPGLPIMEWLDQLAHELSRVDELLSSKARSALVLLEGDKSPGEHGMTETRPTFVNSRKPPPDGPGSDGHVWWKNQSVQLQPVHYRLFKFIGRNRSSAPPKS